MKPNRLICKIYNSLANKRAELYVSKAIWFVAVIIVGMLLMWGIYGMVYYLIPPTDGLFQWLCKVASDEVADT